MEGGGQGNGKGVCFEIDLKIQVLVNRFRVLEKCNVSSVLNERIILSHLSNPFIVNIATAFQDDSNLFLTMDYLRGADLRYHICYK